MRAHVCARLKVCTPESVWLRACECVCVCVSMSVHKCVLVDPLVWRGYGLTPTPPPL